MKKILLILLAIALTGCAITRLLDTSTSSFIANEYMERGTIKVLSGDPKISDSLEFAFYREKIESSLVKQGFTIVKGTEESRFIAYFTFGIDNGVITTSSVPLYGQTGGVTYTSSGTVTSSRGTTGSYSGTTYQMPTYGIVGTTTQSTREFKRVLALDILKVSNDRNKAHTKIIELKTQSIGTCGVITAVFQSLVDGMFTDFPGVNGKTRNKRIQLPEDFNC